MPRILSPGEEETVRMGDVVALEGAGMARRLQAREGGRRRAGTGRQTTLRSLGTIGRRTGVSMKSGVKKDVFGFDDLNEAWDQSFAEEDQGNNPALINRSAAKKKRRLTDTIKRVSLFDTDVESSDPGADADSEDIVDGESPLGQENVVEIDNSFHDVPYFSDGSVDRRDVPHDRDSDSSRDPTTKKLDFDDGDDGEQSYQLEDISTRKPFISPVPAQESPSDKKRITASLTKKAKKNKSRKATAGGKRRRRQTIMMIEHAKECGLVKDEYESLDDISGIRRSKRHRIKPVKYYECETINYKEGLGGLPEIDEEQPTVKLVSTPPEKKKRRRRPGSKNPSKRQKKTAQMSDDDSREEEVSDFDGCGWFYNAQSKVDSKGDVASRPSNLDFFVLGETESANPPVGAKATSHDGLTTGYLRIPPQGEKPKEMPSYPEAFYVISSEPRCLTVQVHSTEYKLSKGDTFTVPAENTYCIKNTSTKKTALIFFAITGGVVPE